MRELGIKGLPTRRLPKGARVAKVTSLDLVRRSFRRDGPDELWMTDITEHPTREGKIYCAVVLDTFSRFVVGWSIDSTQTTRLVLNALGMATQRRQHRDGLVTHSDRGVPFTSWAFSQNVRNAGRWEPSALPRTTPSSRASGDACRSSYSNRRRWKTWIELARAIHDDIEHFHNTGRRHSALGWLTPAEAEARLVQGQG
jgi:putative transposase